MIDTAGPKAPAAARLLPRPDRPALVRGTIIVVLLLLALFALPPLMNGYYTVTMTQVAIYSIVTLGLGLLVGRVGLYSLGQIAVLIIGAWTGARLLFGTGQPFIVVMIEAGLVTMIIGSLITLPALRLRGLYLALITLMLAGAVTVIEATLNFPNGGGGFSGYNGSLVHIPQIRRPSFAGTDPAYYRFSVIVAIVMFLLVYAHLRARPGRAWASIRQSEAASLAAGISTTFYKLWAMALASFVTGVAGALLAGGDRYLYSIDFPIQNSITLLAVVLMGGVFSLAGAVIAAFLQSFLPAMLYQLWSVPYDWLLILFGLGVMQVLATAPGGIADQFPKDMKRLYRLIRRLVSRPAPASSSGNAPAKGGEAA
ncbi:MAG: branched-chain amino acid ABC transporter permease [Trebonia sp.]|uniref:branched-chain amino acid ABC transporter permease n=4 Tax=Trebonia sp. TaxID=2767075 RepID=UPI003C70DE09